MSTAPLEVALAQARERLTARVVDEMYADPFWVERFGARGRVHSRQDGDYHVSYLVEALQAGEPRVFVEYARWLRDLLHAHGMCSRHLAENFERLARAIDEEPWPDRARATAVLAAGADALVHRAGDAGRLDGARRQLAREACEALATADPARLEGAAARARCVDQLENHLSYLADALASGRVDRFLAHTSFTAELLRRRGEPVEHLSADLRALAAAVTDSPAGSETAASHLALAVVALAPREDAP